LERANAIGQDLQLKSLIGTVSKHLARAYQLVGEFEKANTALWNALTYAEEALDQDITQPLSIYAPPRGGFWLVRADDRPEQAAGMLGVMPLAKRTCELKRLYLIPECRGKKWGRKLLEHALEFSRQAEYLEVLVSLQHEQTAALTLLEHHGFKPCARFSEHQHAGIFLSLKLNA